MIPVTVVIPNYNGENYIENCLKALFACEREEFPVIVVDDASKDLSVSVIKDKYPDVTVIENKENSGFAASVNTGIRHAKTPYVILLNNDTEVDPGFVSALLKRIKSSKRIFSVQALMVSLKDPQIVDSAGDFYNLLGWARARGKDKPVSDYLISYDIFSSCAGAAIYRKRLFEKTGYFDERHFAYLEDVDISYRAKLHGYKNVFEPAAVVRHAGSGTSGSRHNAFKVELSAGNSIYLAYKNMPLIQLLINMPFLLTGHFIKLIYFAKKGLFKPYMKGIARGLSLCGNYEKSFKSSFKHCFFIEVELIKNLLTMLPFY